MMSANRFNSLPRLTSFETAGIIIGALLSPLWFFTIGGVNLNPADFVLIFVFISFVFRTGLLPNLITRHAWFAAVIFLCIVGISIFWSSNKAGGLLSFAQYLYIFVGVVPIVSYALKDRSLRWRVFLVLWGVTTSFSLFGLYTYLVGDVSQFRDIVLWYGNQNQFFWLVASGFICSVALALEESLPTSIRLVAICVAVIEIGLIVGGLTLSAVLMVAGGIWLFAGFLAQRRSREAITVFLFATVLATVGGFVFIVRNWEFVYVQGSLYARIPQYTTAIRLGIQHFPLGMGIDAYDTSVHNFFLNYFVEVGILGAISFLALLVVWLRDVLLRALRFPSRVSPFEFAFIAIFGTYIVVIVFQPVPVRRFWWVLFAASWSVAQDRLLTSTTDT